MWREFNDAHSRMLYQMLRETLTPVLANAAPDHMIHHIEIVRRDESFRRPEELALTIVLRPIGSVRTVDDYSDLGTGYKRLESE